jgi:hypothetical protein
MNIKKVNIKILLLAFIALIGLTIISFLGAIVAADDGGSNFITVPLNYIFIIFNFPILFVITVIDRPLIEKYPFIGYLGLAGNILMYSFLVEWIYRRRSYKRKAKEKENHFKREIE